jgi:hypothetical protein
MPQLHAPRGAGIKRGELSVAESAGHLRRVPAPWAGTTRNTRSVLAVGDHIPDARVWLGPREPAAMTDLVAGSSALFLFFLFAWSST